VRRYLVDAGGPGTSKQPPICPSALPVFHFDVCHSLPTNQAKDQSTSARANPASLLRSVPSLRLLDLANRLAEGCLIFPEPTAPAVLGRHAPTFENLAHGLAEMAGVTQQRLGVLPGRRSQASRRPPGRRSQASRRHLRNVSVNERRSWFSIRRGCGPLPSPACTG
jgi:hypothetical protein